MFKVFVTSTHPGDSIKHLAESFYVAPNPETRLLNQNELIAALQNKDAVISTLDDRIDKNVLSECPDIKLIANVAVGFDNIDIAEASNRGILVTNTPGVLDNSTADLAFALILACARRVAESDRYIRDGKWLGWYPDLMLGCDVHGKKLGIVGYGRIGKAIARRAAGFGMNIVYSRSQTSTLETSPDELGARQVTLDELLSVSDFISLNCPLNQSTHHLIGQREFSLMQPHAILINTARGAVVNQAALIEALENNHLRGAGLDVFENEPNVPDELKLMPQVVLTPHIGSASVETRSAMAQLAVDGLISAFNLKQPSNCVNTKAWDAFVDRTRLAAKSNNHLLGYSQNHTGQK